MTENQKNTVFSANDIDYASKRAQEKFWEKQTKYIYIWDRFMAWRFHKADLIGANAAMQEAEKGLGSLSDTMLKGLVDDYARKNKRIELFRNSGEGFYSDISKFSFLAAIPLVVCAVAFPATAAFAVFAGIFIAASLATGLAEHIVSTSNTKSSIPAGETARNLFSSQLDMMVSQGMDRDDAVKQLLEDVKIRYADKEMFKDEASLSYPSPQPMYMQQPVYQQMMPNNQQFSFQPQPIRYQDIQQSEQWQNKFSSQNGNKMLDSRATNGDKFQQQLQNQRQQYDQSAVLQASR